MILANAQEMKMNLSRRAWEPGAVGNTHGSISPKWFFDGKKYFLATFHYGWHTHGKFEIMWILLPEL